MQSCQIPVLLLLLISGAEALRCKFCLPVRPGAACHYSVRRCIHENEVCAVVYNRNPESIAFKRCMVPEKVQSFSADPRYRVVTCDTDLCN